MYRFTKLNRTETAVSRTRICGNWATRISKRESFIFNSIDYFHIFIDLLKHIAYMNCIVPIK